MCKEISPTVLIAFLFLVVSSLSAQTPTDVELQRACGDREPGYGRSNKPPVITGKPYTVPELRLQFTDAQTGAPIGKREVIVRYVWRWFEYPYPERVLGVWSDDYDLVRCTATKDGIVQLTEFKVIPIGWYKGKMLMGRKPEFTHIDVSVNLEKQITHFRITKHELERYHRDGVDRIPLRVSPLSISRWE